MKRLLFVLPVLLFAGIAAAAFLRLRSDAPDVLPSALIDRPAPAFDLPPLPGMARGLASPDQGGKPVLVKVLASWCCHCLADHTLLTRLAKEQGIQLTGITATDRPQAHPAWLR